MKCKIRICDENLWIRMRRNKRKDKLRHIRQVKGKIELRRIRKSNREAERKMNEKKLVF